METDELAPPPAATPLGSPKKSKAEMGTPSLRVQTPSAQGEPSDDLQGNATPGPSASPRPFPLPSPEKHMQLDDEDASGHYKDLPELESSPEPDMAILTGLLEKTRPTPSQESPAALRSPLPSMSPSQSKHKKPKPKSNVQKSGSTSQSQSQSQHAARSPPSTPSPAKPKSKRKASPIEITDSPPAKRVKTKRMPKRHETYWLLDGTVVIQIHNMQFRLHRSRLARQSGFFNRLFDDGEDAVDGHVDGYALYIVRDVLIKDMEVLLDAMDNAITYFADPPQFDTLAALLRASTLLEFPTYRRYAAERIQSVFSPDLAALTRERLPHTEAMEAVILGRDYDLPAVLKRAFYELLRTGGFGREDDDRDDPALDDGDFNRLVRTREKLTSAWVLAAASAPSTFVCPMRQPCLTAAQKMATWPALVHTSGIFEEHLYDPLCGYQMLMEDCDWKGVGYCEDCIAQRREGWEGARKKIWENLDVWLDLKRD